jgi:hypothetical protein
MAPDGTVPSPKKETAQFASARSNESRPDDLRPLHKPKARIAGEVKMTQFANSGSLTGDQPLHSQASNRRTSAGENFAVGSTSSCPVKISLAKIPILL